MTSVKINSCKGFVISIRFLDDKTLNIETNNREKKKKSELKRYLNERNHPPEKIDYTFTKCFQPKLDKCRDLGKIILTSIFNPGHVVNLSK